MCRPLKRILISDLGPLDSYFSNEVVIEWLFTLRMCRLLTIGLPSFGRPGLSKHVSSLELVSLLGPFPSVFLLLRSVLSEHVREFDFAGCTRQIQTVTGYSYSPSVIDFVTVAWPSELFGFSASLVIDFAIISDSPTFDAPPSGIRFSLKGENVPSTVSKGSIADLSSFVELALVSSLWNFIAFALGRDSFFPADIMFAESLVTSGYMWKLPWCPECAESIGKSVPDYSQVSSSVCLLSVYRLMS